MNEMKEFTLKVKTFLKDTGLTSIALANHANVSPALLSRVINEKQQDVTLNTYVSLENAMKALKSEIGKSNA